MEKLLKEATRIATAAHAGQVDKADVPYIKHPEAVANYCETTEQKIVAWLHDVLEDTSVSAETLASVFPGHIVEAVQALTRKPDEDYMSFVRRASHNPIARVVKMADLRHNMDLSRLPNASQKDMERRQRYESALAMLSA